MSRPVYLLLLAGGAAAVVGVAWAAPAPSSSSASPRVSRTYACGERSMLASSDGERAWVTIDDETFVLRRAAGSAARYDGPDMVLLEEGGHAVLRTPGRVELCLR